MYLTEEQLEDLVKEIIRKTRGKKEWCVKSKKTGRNLGCSSSKKGAQKREKQVKYFKYMGESMKLTRKKLRRMIVQQLNEQQENLAGGTLTQRGVQRFAQELWKAVSGLGTNKSTIQTILIGLGDGKDGIKNLKALNAALMDKKTKLGRLNSKNQNAIQLIAGDMYDYAVFIEKHFEPGLSKALRASGMSSADL